MNFVHVQKEQEPKTHTTSPVYVGSSIIGMKYKDGIIIASDTNLAYGSMIRLMNLTDRIQQITPRTMIGYSGEYSDFQESFRILNELVLSDSIQGPSYLGPKELSNYMASLHYYQRNQIDPFLNSIVIGGFDWNGESVLMNVDSFGTLLPGNYFTTSYAHYFCNAIFREEYPEDYQTVTKEKAIDILKKCFEVLYYRQKTAGNVIVYKTLEKRGENQFVFEENKVQLETRWDYDGYKNFSNEKYYLTN